MNIPLSKRLQACCSFVNKGDRVADIGCDHGYLGIHLLHEGLASSVIASDINEMPLQSAVRNAERFAVGDRISFYLSDGARSIPRDFDVLICAGMGADTMISILENAQWLQKEGYRLILQCQSKTPMLRQYLSDHGWNIRDEKALRDGRFLYTVMEVLWQPESARLTSAQCHFPPALLNHPCEELREYYQQVCFRLDRAVTAQKEAADPAMAQALEMLRTEPAYQFLKEG